MFQTRTCSGQVPVPAPGYCSHDKRNSTKNCVCYLYSFRESLQFSLTSKLSSITKYILKVVTNEKGEASGAVLTIRY